MMLTLQDVVLGLERHYGKPAPPKITDPFELVVWENVGYVVDDARRGAAFAALKKAFGLPPAVLAVTPTDRMAEVIAGGGMQARQRAEKVKKAAAIALDIGQKTLRDAVKRDPEHAKKLLKRFPGIGEPGADKILLFARSQASVAPESNGLRVLVRLGLGHPHDDYARTYRLTTEALEDEVGSDIDFATRAHLLLRRHGQELCKTTKPRCDACPLERDCAFAGNGV